MKKTDQTRAGVSRRFVAMAGASAIFLPGAAWPQDNRRDVEGGIGGTGIVGLLTDFGSLVVCGHRIETDARTRFTNPFGPIPASALRLGMSLTIEARGGLRNLRARRVHVSYPLVGRIQSVSNSGRSLLINGTAVQLQSALRGFSVGDRVAVSGVWRGAAVQASLLQAARGDVDYASGDLSRSDGVTRVGASALRGRGFSGARTGSFGAASGVYDPQTDQLVTRAYQNARFEGAAGPLRRLSVEGYLTPTARAPGYQVEGLGHSFARNLQLSQFAGVRMLFDGLYSGVFEAANAVELPENPDRRRRLLKQLSTRRG